MNALTENILLMAFEIKPEIESLKSFQSPAKLLKHKEMMIKLRAMKTKGNVLCICELNANVLVLNNIMPFLVHTVYTILITTKCATFNTNNVKLCVVFEICKKIGDALSACDTICNCTISLRNEKDSFKTFAVLHTAFTQTNRNDANK